MAGEQSLIFEGALHPGLIAAVAALLVGAAVWSAVRAKATWSIKFAVVMLRTVAAVLIAVALLAPTRMMRDEIVLRPPALVLVDASESMNLRDTESGTSRREAVVGWLAERKTLMDAIAKKYDVSRFDFGKDLAARDNSGIPVLIAVSSADGVTETTRPSWQVMVKVQAL